MEVERAVSALEEVRVRLASCQRFRGYSGPAAVLSGLVAVAAGLFQQTVAARPSSAAEVDVYLRVWLSVLAVALLLNYGTVALWHARAPRLARRQTQTVAFAILPSLGLAAVLSYSLLMHGLPWLLPGLWYACYGTGLFASRTLMPRGVLPVACGFAAIGALRLVSPDRVLPRSWWVRPLGFGFGQIAIGTLLVRDSAIERSAA